MTRLALALGLSVAALALGLVTAAVQSHNREKSAALDAQHAETTLIEAVNKARAARIFALDSEPLPLLPSADALRALARKASQKRLEARP